MNGFWKDVFEVNRNECLEIRKLREGFLYIMGEAF